MLSDPCLFLDLAFVNKALHMDPHVSRLVRLITEYSAKQGSSGFTKEHWPGMKAAILLLVLKQGTRSLEVYIVEYLALANGSELPDCMLIDFFCDGLNQSLKSRVVQKGPLSSQSNFLDYVLWTVGPAFTVGVVEERDTALTCVMVAALEHTHKMAATAEPDCKMADTTVPHYVTAANPESSQDTADLHESSQVTVDRHESSQVTVDLHQVTADLHESSHS